MRIIERAYIYARPNVSEIIIRDFIGHGPSAGPERVIQRAREGNVCAAFIGADTYARTLVDVSIIAAANRRAFTLHLPPPFVLPLRSTTRSLRTPSSWEGEDRCLALRRGLIFRDASTLDVGRLVSIVSPDRARAARI